MIDQPINRVVLGTVQLGLPYGRLAGTALMPMERAWAILDAAWSLGVRAFDTAEAYGDAVTLGELSFSILHCPGHTPGSVVFFNAENRFALVGDVLFSGSVGRTDFAYGDHDALIQAIKQKLLPLGDDVAFLPGHGGTSTLGAERASNQFLVG